MSMPSQSIPSFASNMADLATMFPAVDVMEEEEDIDTETLVIVDGWRTSRLHIVACPN